MSPLDWVNTRRTFEGYKLFWKGTDWDIDAFWTNPVGIEPTSLDSPNQDQEFMGIYSTYKGSESETIGFYYLRLINSRGTNDFQFDTLGTRWQGSHCDWLWEVEGAVQFGDNTAGSDHSAGFYTLGLGRKLPCCTWSPTLLVYCDWASGDDTQFNGYDHLFSLAHKYNGFMDLFGRRNLEDTNVLLTLQPNPKTRLLMWYHLFYLQDGNDIPYSVAMGPSPVNAAPITPGGSPYLGQELDLLASYNLTAQMNLLFGYFHFWSGSWFTTNPTPPPFAGDADFFYTQLAVNF